MTEPRKPLFPVSGWPDGSSTPPDRDDSGPRPAYPSASAPAKGPIHSESQGGIVSAPTPPTQPNSSSGWGEKQRPWFIGLGAASLLVVLTLGYMAFGRNQEPTDPPSTVGASVPAAGSSVGPIEACGGAPVFNATGVQDTRSGLLLTVSARCPGGGALSTDELLVTVTDGSITVAAGSFDFSKTPMALTDSSGTEVTLQFPAQSYWLPASALSGSVTVAVQDIGTSSATRSASTSVPTVVATAPATPAGGTDAAATAALRRLADSDAILIRANMENRWVPQLSSKRVGLVAEGITWSNSDILREHLELRQKFQEARLIWSPDWRTFSQGEWWVTAVSSPQPSGEAANTWCERAGYDADHCFAKIISSTLPPEGTTLSRK